jgi:hypothetical protein
VRESERERKRKAESERENKRERCVVDIEHAYVISENREALRERRKNGERVR